MHDWPGHRHARQVLSLRERARVLREAVNVLQPLLAGGTLLEGNFRWMCASMVPLGDFRSMGRVERPVFACRPAMRQHMQQLQQHCLELWIRRLSTPGAGRKDYFLAGYLPRRPGGGAPARSYEIVRAQRPRAVGVAAPATGSGRQAGTMPPVPHPPEAAVRAMSAGTTGSGALLRAGSQGTPSGSGGDSGLVKGPVGVAGASGAATGAAS